MLHTDDCPKARDHSKKCDCGAMLTAGIDVPSSLTHHGAPPLGTQIERPSAEAINHPQHYGGDTPYEAIKVIEAWGLGFCLGNAVKYISRAGRKDPTKIIEDLKKARWYLDREISQLESTK